MAPTAGSSAEGPRVALLQDRRLMLLLIAIGVILWVAASAISFSGALFSSTSRSPGNEFAAGTMGLTLSQTGPVVDGTAWLPGARRSGDQVVTNTGHRAALVLDVVGLAASPLNAVLQVEVRQTQPAGTVLYDGSLGNLDEVSLGTLARDERRTYRITVTWPASQDSPTLEGARTSLDFDWRLESVP